MQIKPLDATEAASLQIARLALTSEKIMRQTGLRWLFEAIAGGSLAAIDPLSLLPQNPENEAVKIDPAAEAASFSGLQEVLRTHRTILVGHNFFTDLIYMYATFFGPLPETFEAFAVEIHKLFPTIIDTKYLATADRGGGEKGLPKNPHNWASSLAELDEALKAQEVPLITTHPDHLQYEMEASLHEAGYDSYLTAKILVRLSANLSQQQQQKPKEKVNNTSKGSKKTLESSNSSKKTSKPTVLVETSESEEGGVELPNGSGVGTGAQEGGSSSRSSKNYAGSNNRNNSKEARDRRNMMPSFDSRFWDIYSNRVRVFGTQEGSMDLHKPW
jgi:poly(A)-specific ribonuclease